MDETISGFGGGFFLYLVIIAAIITIAIFLGIITWGNVESANNAALEGTNALENALKNSLGFYESIDAGAKNG